MKRIEDIRGSLFNTSKSTPDSNRFYSILLDTRASTISENMYDIAERLLSTEKESAKKALEGLWALKKNMQAVEENGTVDILIQFYQDKLNVLRKREEYLRRISKDSRELLEEKRKRDTEVASVKQDISDFSRDLEEISTKLKKLRTKEQELLLIEEQLKKELSVNENEIVNGLYEIILSAHEEQSGGLSFEDPGVVPPLAPAAAADDTARREPVELSEVGPPAPTPAEPVATVMPAPATEAEPEETLAPADDKPAETDEKPEPPVQEAPQKPPFPKSVVKTTRGRVIGEYFYDASAYKNKREYIFNGAFFLDQLAAAHRMLNDRFDEPVYNELLQMIHDAFKRVSSASTLHFEESTKEILNGENLMHLWQEVKIRKFEVIRRFCERLKVKIDTLGMNHTAMLIEQMQRYSRREP